MPVDFNITYSVPYVTTAGTYTFSTANTGYVNGGSVVFGYPQFSPATVKPPEPKDEEDVPALWEIL